jgi:hypothetical protein
MFLVFSGIPCWYSLGNQLDSSGVDEMELEKVKIWEQVDACAACKQNTLFDYTREAQKEEVLHKACLKLQIST